MIGCEMDLTSPDVFDELRVNTSLIDLDLSCMTLIYVLSTKYCANLLTYDNTDNRIRNTAAQNLFSNLQFNYSLQKLSLGSMYFTMMSIR